MLFHVTMTHTPEDCPAYHPEALPECIDKVERIDRIAEELNVKVHFLLWGAPEHVAYALLECDSLGAVSQYVNAIPFRQEFRVTPVEHLDQVIESSRAIIARAQA